MNQTFLLQEVIDDLINVDKSLSAALIKLNYFGRLIKNKELIDYTQNELNGYKDKESVPSYRKTIGTLYIDMQAYYNRHTGILPISMIDEKYRFAFQNVYVTEGIAAIEKLARESESDAAAGQIVSHFPMEMLHVLQEPARTLYKSDTRIDVIGARLTGNVNIVVEIPNAIRTKLLDFVISIADTFGYNIEIESFNEKGKTNNQTIIHQMNTIINNSGDGNLINTGNENKIDNNITLYKGDIGRLQKELLKQGIEEVDVKEISEIVQSEDPNKEKKLLGEKSNDWISKIINKSLNGVGKIATGISSNLLAALIKQYYGL
ncbi:MAG: hypothetical protein J0I41_01575 [Filimonas sp.]|nr:hypothetical protein [Filimonas sp.]